MKPESGPSGRTGTGCMVIAIVLILLMGFAVVFWMMQPGGTSDQKPPAGEVP